MGALGLSGASFPTWDRGYSFQAPVCKGGKWSSQVSKTSRPAQHVLLLILQSPGGGQTLPKDAAIWTERGWWQDTVLPCKAFFRLFIDFRLSNILLCFNILLWFFAHMSSVNPLAGSGNPGFLVLFFSLLPLLTVFPSPPPKPDWLWEKQMLQESRFYSGLAFWCLQRKHNSWYNYVYAIFQFIYCWELFVQRIHLLCVNSNKLVKKSYPAHLTYCGGAPPHTMDIPFLGFKLHRCCSNTFCWTLTSHPFQHLGDTLCSGSTACFLSFLSVDPAWTESDANLSGTVSGNLI